MLIKSYKKRISSNVVGPVVQVIVSGVVLFVLYRYLYDRLGVELIGVWSLVLAATSVSRIGDFGLSAGVVKFVAQALGRGNTQRAADVVQTVALTLGVFMAVLLVVGYPLFVLALEYFIPAHRVPIALSILPYALMSLWVMVVVSVFCGGLDGCMRMDLRSWAIGFSHLVYLGLTMLLVPQYGLEGVAMAQLIQSVGLMVILWWMLRRQLVQLPFVYLHWKLPVLKEMIGYGVNFQIITVMNMLFDSLVKALLSKLGGLGDLGYYEMANKLILKGRSIIVEASRVMVPAIAMMGEYDAVKATQLFMVSYRMTFYVSVLCYGLLGVFITTISMIWLGQYQATFIQFALLLNLGWFVNTLIGPAYFSNLGSGKLRPNMISHGIMGICSLFVGVPLGLNFGGLGVISGMVLGLTLGSIFLLISYFKLSGLHWSEYIIPQGVSKTLVLSPFAILLSYYLGKNQSSIVEIIGVAILCSVPLLMLKRSNCNLVMMSSRGK